MGQIGALLTLIFIWSFGSIDVKQGFIMGIIVFIASLFISRLFDNYIVKGTHTRGGHIGIRDVILKYF